MNKLATTALFFLVVLTGAAPAKPPQKVTVQFDGLCDTMTLTYDAALFLYASSHVISIIDI